MSIDFDRGCGCRAACDAWCAEDITPSRPTCDILLATAYVRPQAYNEIFMPTRALAMGTIFPELVSPWGKCS